MANSSPRITVRAATTTDKAAIKQLIRAVRINPYGLNWRRFYVAVDASGTLIGCGQIKPHRDGSWELASIAVAPVWRKQGVATAIIRQLIQTHNGTLWLTCASPLTPFYKKFGFVEIKEPATMPCYFRWASRLARLITSLRPGARYLAVMRYRPNGLG